MKSLKLFEMYMKHNLVKKWLVAQIKSHSYNLAIRNLERQGFETFLPKMKVTIKKEKKFINKDAFVFPGYVFIGVNSHRFNWTKINSTYGISKVLVFNNKPREVSYNFIVALKNKYEATVESTLKESLEKGDAIKFNSGPFVDLIAMIENVNETNRIGVLLDIMGGYRKLIFKQTESREYIKI